MKTIGIILTCDCAHLVEAAVKRLPAGVFDELFIVDDSSKKDNIEEVAKKLNIPLFTYPYSGYGENLRNGLKIALEKGADYMVELHGDGQFDASITPQAIKKMEEENLDLLIGSRFIDLRQPLKDGMPLHRYLANIGLSFIERLVLKIPFTEFHPGFRVYRKRFIEKIGLDKGADDYLYSFEIIALAAYEKMRCAEIPARADYHRPHTSSGNLRAAWNCLQEIWVLFLYVLANLGFKTKLFP